MKLQFEYGTGVMDCNLPDDRTDVFIPGETVADPPALEDPIAATREAILNPIGIEPLSKLGAKGKKAVIIFPDKVKGGFQATAHRKVSIPIIIEELLKAGVEKKDILLICSNGLHRKNKPEEIKSLLDEKTFNDFWYSGQIINHDSEDYEHLVDLGYDEMGSHVIMNKYVYECDIPILIGHSQGNPYGGYSGGYKHCATGISHWRTIGGNHCPEVMHRSDFTPVRNDSVMRKKFDATGRHMEKCMGHPFWTCDAVLDTYARQMAVYAGRTDEVQKISWKLANKRTYVPWAKKKYDIMVFGMPQQFHYGNGHGTNPILMLQAVSAQMIRHKRVMKDNCVIIFSSICNGYFHEEEFTGYRELYDRYQQDYHCKLSDLAKYGEYWSTNEDFVRQYRFDYGFHPFHCFSMISCGEIALLNTSKIFCVGAYEPGFARGIGFEPVATFEEAFKLAEKYVGKEPSILALPKTFKIGAVHLMMENESPDDVG